MIERVADHIHYRRIAVPVINLNPEYERKRICAPSEKSPRMKLLSGVVGISDDTANDILPTS
jgi:hypothetical protein